VKQRQDMIPMRCQRHSEDSSLTRAPALRQNIKCSGRGSGCGSGEPTRASSEAESHLRGRLALERGRISPEVSSSPRARRNPTREGIQPSSEVESRWHGVVPHERNGVSPEGCRAERFGGPLRLLGSCAPVAGP
jgi:hypothetical protein